MIELCPFGRCGWGQAFLKEPKFVAAVTGGGYTRMSVLDGGGAVAADRLEENRDGSWLSPACLWAGGSPRLHTAQCDDPARAAARFDFGGYGSGADGRCGARGCLLVRMVAAPSALRSSAASGAGAEARWQNARTGLDGWAIASAARQRYAPEDSAVDGVRWGCKGPSVASPPNTSRHPPPRARRRRPLRGRRLRGRERSLQRLGGRPRLRRLRARLAHLRPEGRVVDAGRDLHRGDGALGLSRSRRAAAG